MSEDFQTKLEQKAKESANVNLNELGETFKGILIKSEFKTDARTNEACYLTIKIAKGNVVQKYGKSLYQTLLEKIKLSGGLEALKANEYTWKAEKAGRATFNRYFPVPNPEKAKK